VATMKSIPLSQIDASNRIRPVDMDYAASIAASMIDRGLINPITVRSTPAANGGKTPYTLIAGGNRLAAAEMNGWEEIDAIVMSADAAEAQMMEIAENLYRNELSALDRSVFVLKYRELYEEKHGSIPSQGGRPKKQCNDCTVIFSPGKELSERVQERLGIGRRTYFNVTKIGQKLHPALRAALRGTPAEDDQKQLLKLASMPEAEQAGIAAALKFEPDLKKVLAMDKPKPVQADPQEVILSKISALLERADLATLDRIAVRLAEARGKFEFGEAA